MRRTIRRDPDPATPVGGASPAPEDTRLSRANKATLGAFFAALVVLVAGSLVHLPYAVTSPGPVVDTLGTQEQDGKQVPLIAVSGLPTYPTSGALDFTTVSIAGGPGYPVDLWDVLGAWVDPARDVQPVHEVFDPQATQEQIAEENSVQMEGSQQEATAVALRAIGQDVPAYITVAGLTSDSKAKGILRAGDRFVSVAGVDVRQAQDVVDGLQTVEVGQPVDVVVTRGGKGGERVEATVTTVAGQNGRTALGTFLRLDHDFPAKVTINAGAVGGPSAGLMFSLGIYDKLTEGSLTGDRRIAGTGTIDDAADVGPIGGIKQKMAGARDGGADFFLAPADNCDEVVGNVPDGLEVFKVSTFDQGRAAVEAIAKGDTGALPRC
ncbi:YlbL family protein [Terracoccus luteus]|uniref:endopeptidase La n=1 Tax=Terracoccus luteus TaxID=53356 RepID=A0A839PV29_9MICO|nr:S16 family serine protease [Terracoccus luteus]MBB2985826.1 PDZ domain-containing protein [Terracoccus luteus]MCP2171478.1 PDZ domain-containing protein [Terracoccus luteus]